MRDPIRPREATARAHANIALAKYWGKAAAVGNVPAVPSVSITLGALTTTTSVRFDPALGADELTLDGRTAGAGALERVSRLLDEVRARAGIRDFASVRSANDFPTASGLASSASAFAALTLASARAAGLALSAEDASDLARRASASAARSVFGGFVRLDAGSAGQRYLAASPLAPPDHWPLRVVVAVTSDKPKPTGSTAAMNHTAATSPFYPAWLELAPRLAERVQRAIAERDLARLGEAAEHSALAMHACAMAAAPAVVYFEPATLAVLAAVRALREQGVAAFATMDAGPHVKVVTLPEHAPRVDGALRAVPGVLRTIASGLGGDATVLEREDGS
jgi:diphosphomevalonate decarboxylase